MQKFQVSRETGIVSRLTSKELRVYEDVRSTSTLCLNVPSRLGQVAQNRLGQVTQNRPGARYKREARELRSMDSWAEHYTPVERVPRMDSSEAYTHTEPVHRPARRRRGKRRRECTSFSLS